jgi:hypothetical protein
MNAPSRTRRGLLATAGLGLLALVGCVGPTLIAASALGSLGAALRSPWLGLASAVGFAVAIATVLARRRRARRNDQ